MSTEIMKPDDDIVRVEQTAIGAITKSEIESQLDAAHRYPRSIKRFLDEAIGLATFSEEIAQSCIYSLPRGKDEHGQKKVITGPSVRLAEIVMSAYGNIHAGMRVVGAEDKEVLSQGIAWDLEKNVRITVEKRRKILDSKGRRYSEDMVNVTANAGASIAFRDAIFRVIPKAYVTAVYNRAREVAVGNQSTLVDKRAKMFDGFQKMGIAKDRVLNVLERQGIEDVTLTDIETLIGLANALKDGTVSIDEAFPSATVADLTGKKPSSSAIDRIVEARTKKPEPETLVTPEGEIKAATTAPADRDSRTVPPDFKPAPPKGEPCTNDDLGHLETLATECGVRWKEVKKHIEQTMSFASWDALTRDRLPEVERWIEVQRSITKK